LNGLERPKTECSAHTRDRALADEDLAGRSSLLEPGGDVDGIAGRE
jgi:hypothetical protein